jgi:hypothetical protein
VGEDDAAVDGGGEDELGVVGIVELELVRVAEVELEVKDAGEVGLVPLPTVTAGLLLAVKERTSSVSPLSHEQGLEPPSPQQQ